jgi:hypothetical protein
LLNLYCQSTFAFIAFFFQNTHSFFPFLPLKSFPQNGKYIQN